MTLPGFGDQVKRHATDRFITLPVKRVHVRATFELTTAIAAGYGAYIDQGIGAVIPVFAVTLVSLSQYRRRQ